MSGKKFQEAKDRFKGSMEKLIPNQKEARTMIRPYRKESSKVKTDNKGKIIFIGKPNKNWKKQADEVYHRDLEHAVVYPNPYFGENFILCLRTSFSLGPNDKL